MRPSFSFRSTPLGWHLSLQGFCRFLDHLRNRNIALVRNGVDEIERVPPEPNVELMIPARKLPPALESLCFGEWLRGRNGRDLRCWWGRLLWQSCCLRKPVASGDSGNRRLIHALRRVLHRK